MISMPFIVLIEKKNWAKTLFSSIGLYYGDKFVLGCKTVIKIRNFVFEFYRKWPQKASKFHNFSGPQE